MGYLVPLKARRSIWGQRDFNDILFNEVGNIVKNDQS